MSSPIGRSKHYSLKKGTYINAIFFFSKTKSKWTQHCWSKTPTLLDVTCCVRLHTRVVGSCCAKFKKGQTFVLFRDRQRVAQPWLFPFAHSSNIVRATHANYTWYLKPYGLYPGLYYGYPSHDALQLPTLLGLVASACT